MGKKKNPDKWPNDGSKENRCTATVYKTGERCKRLAVTGYEVCAVHGAGTLVRVANGTRKRPGHPIVTGANSKYFKENVLQKIEDFRNDPDLEKLDFELAYLKSLLPRIEDVDNEDLSEVDRIVLLEKIIASIFKNMDTREKVIENRRYSIGVEKLKLLIKFMFSAVQKHVDDPEILRKIGLDLRDLANKTDNSDDVNSMIGQ